MKKRTGLRMAMLTVAVAAVLALPAQAIASDNCSTADPTTSQYCTPTKVIGSGSASGSLSVQGASTSSSGSLPFTGLDVISLLAIAAALTGAGLVLRHLTASGGERSS
jgi:hypothetical protein